MFPLETTGTFQLTSTRRGRITLTVTSRGAEGATQREVYYSYAVTITLSSCSHVYSLTHDSVHVLVRDTQIIWNFPKASLQHSINLLPSY